MMADSSNFIALTNSARSWAGSGALGLALFLLCFSFSLAVLCLTPTLGAGEGWIIGKTFFGIGFGFPTGNM